MERRKLLGALAAALLVAGCKDSKPSVSANTISPDRDLEQFKTFMAERKNIVVPGFYNWLKETEPDMPLSLDETMKGIVLVGSYKEWETLAGSREGKVLGKAPEPRVYFNVERFNEKRSPADLQKGIDAALLYGAANILTKKVDQPNYDLILTDSRGRQVKADRVFIKGFAMYGYFGSNQLQRYINLEVGASTALVHHYLQDNSNTTVLLTDSDLPAGFILFAAKLNNDMKSRNISPKLFRSLHVNSDLERFAAAFAGASDLKNPPQEAIDKGLVYLKREYGN